MKSWLNPSKILILNGPKKGGAYTIQNLATDFRTIGHSWGVLRNLAEVPLFLNSRASRLIQLADLVAYSIFKAYEKNDVQFFNVFSNKLDKQGGFQHGLSEHL